MGIVKVTIVKKWAHFQEGDEVHVDEAKAATLVDAGIGDDGKPKKVQKKKEVVFRSGPGSSKKKSNAKT